MASVTRADFAKAITEAYEWYWEGAQKEYEQYPTIFDKIADVRPLSDIDGAYAQLTSGIGMDEIPEKEENQAIELFNPTEGYTVIIKKRRYDVIIPATEELDEDFFRAKGFLNNFVKSDVPRAVRVTKEKILARLLDNGFDTSGNSVYNNTVTNVVEDASGDLIYDSSAFFEADGSGQEHTSKGGTDYYNSVGDVALNYDNLITADNLLTITNAKMENDEPFNNNINKKLVVKNNKINAMTLLQSINVAGSDKNDKNVLNDYEMIFNPYLSNALYWYTLRAKFGIVMYTTDEPKIYFWQDQNSGEFRVRIHLVVASGVYNFRGSVGAPATS